TNKAVATQETKKEKSTIVESESKFKTDQKIADNEKVQVKEETSFAVQNKAISKSEKTKENSITDQITEDKSVVVTEKVVAEQQEVTSLSDTHNLLAKEEERDAEKSDAKQHGKWSVGPQVAPVYYNSVTGGSSLDSQFNDSSKEGGINMSMGLQVAYQVNDNWQLRSGINRVNVGYATNNVQVGYSDPILAMANINYNNVPDGEVV